MRILYLSQYFPPEVGATQTRAYEMARGLVEAGHQVTMITEFPNHPAGVFPPEYQRKVFERAELDGIEVVRVWVFASTNKNFRNRIAFYVSYMMMAVLGAMMLVRGRYDLVYATSPPLFVGWAAIFISFLRRIPMVFEVRDLWPESAIALGILRGRYVIKWATWLEEACYRRSSLIVVTTEEMVPHLVERGIAAEKIRVIRNGANIELFQFSAEHRDRYRSELGLENSFIVIYAGLIGIAQGLHIALEGASRLGKEMELVHFLLIGDGPYKERLLAKADQMGLKNITFLPSKPREQIPGYLSAAEVALVPLTSQRLIGALPSKMFDAMACQRPVILSAEGEAAEVLKSAKAGIIIPPEDDVALANVILHLKDNPGLCRELGCNGRQAVESKYSRQALAGQLVQLLESLFT